MSDNERTGPSITPDQQFLNDLWEEHVRDEFVTRDTGATLATMAPDAYVNHVPVMTGGVGREALYEFYSRLFIPKMPADTEIVPVSRTIGTDRLVDEMIFRFTHTVEMEWMLPGVPPTGKRVEIPLVAIVHFRDGKVAHEHIYWDQASVLVQLGLLSPSTLPIAGVETARKVTDPSRPSNELIRRAEAHPQSGVQGGSSRDADYVLGRSNAEQRRLLDQAAFLRPATERMLRAAGIGPAMRVLDVGCGVGDVSFLVAELVGPSGAVVGIDLDADALAFAEQRRVEMRLANVSFVRGDFRSAALGGEFDAAVGRLVLMYQADPTDALRAIASRLRRDGIVAFQEPAVAALAWQPPNLPLLTSVATWVREVFARSGAHVNVGWELYWRMRDAGLAPHPGPLGEVPLDVGPDSTAYDRWATLTRSLQPKIIEYGLATDAEIDIETLEQRLREEAMAARATIPLFSSVLVGQWARKVSTE